MTHSLTGRTMAGLFWSAAERFSNIGVQSLFLILLARLLTPADYGLIGMLAIFLAVAQLFIDSGFSSALIRKVNRTEEDYETAFCFNIAVGVLSYALLFLIAPWIAGFYEIPALKDLARVVSLNLIFNSLCVVQTARLTIALDFKLQAKVSLAAAALAGCLALSMAYAGFGVWALAGQSVAAGALRCLFLWWACPWRPQIYFSMDSFRELFGFGSKLLAAGILETVYSNLYLMTIGKVFSAGELGLYARAEQFANLPSSQATGVLQRVTFPVLSAIQEEEERLRKNYLRLLRMSAFLIFPMMALLVAVSEPLVHLVLTERWAGCVPYLQILCFSLMWYPIHAINLNLLQVKGRSDLFLRLEIVKKILGVAILAVTIPMGILAMCVGRVVNSLLCLFVNTYYTGRLLRAGCFCQLSEIKGTLAESLLMAAAVYFFLPLLPENPLLRTAGGVTSGAALFLLLAWMSGGEELRETLRIFHQWRGKERNQ